MYTPNPSTPYPAPYASNPSLTHPLPSTPSPSPITSLTVKNPLVNKLKVLLQQKLSSSPSKKPTNPSSSTEPPFPITKERIFAPAGKAYFILNSLFQSYKKRNQFKLLQEKVHTIEVYRGDGKGKEEHEEECKMVGEEDVEVLRREGGQSSDNINAPNNNNKSTLTTISKPRVTPHTIFSSHCSQLSGRQITKFIEIQCYIKPGVKNELINQILKAISNLQDLKEIMKCYQKLLSARYCREGRELRELVEEKMIKKVLAVEFYGGDKGGGKGGEEKRAGGGKGDGNTATTTTTNTNPLSTDHHQFSSSSFNPTSSHPSNLSNPSTPLFPCPFLLISTTLLGLPTITPTTLYFIGLLYDKIPSDLEPYEHHLYPIMKHNLPFQLHNSKEKGEGYLQDVLSNPTNKKVIEALIKVNTKENNELIRQLLRAYGKIRDKNSGQVDDAKVVNVGRLAEIEAHYKLVKLVADQEMKRRDMELTDEAKRKQKDHQELMNTMITQPSPISQPVPPQQQQHYQHMQLPPQQPFRQPHHLTPPMVNTITPVTEPIKLEQPQQPSPPPYQQPPITPKTQYTLKFITQVIKSGSNLWVEINEWLKFTTSQNSKTFLVNEITTFLDKAWTDEKKVRQYIVPHVKIVGKLLEETSQVYRLWMGQLLKPVVVPLTGNKDSKDNKDKDKDNKTSSISSPLSQSPLSTKEKYLKHPTLKRFLLKGITHPSNLALFTDSLLHPSLLHSQLLLDIFTLLQKDKAFIFYKKLIETEPHSKAFFAYLTTLNDNNPVRMKEWLVQADQLRGGELFACARNALVEFVKTSVRVEVAFNWVRDMAMYPPSKFLVYVLINLIAVFRDKKDFPALRNGIARTINLILVRTPISKLSEEFKKHLPSLAQEFKDFKDDYDLIFADVTQEVLMELKRAHKESQGMRF